MNTETLRIRHHLLDEDLADVADVLVVERSLYSRFLQQEFISAFGLVTKSVAPSINFQAL